MGRRIYIIRPTYSIRYRKKAVLIPGSNNPVLGKDGKPVMRPIPYQVLKKVTRKNIQDAAAANCFEIAQGIPPALQSVVTPEMLPFVYEEPEAAEPQPERDLAAEIDELKERLALFTN